VRDSSLLIHICSLSAEKAGPGKLLKRLVRLGSNRHLKAPETNKQTSRQTRAALKSKLAGPNSNAVKRTNVPQMAAFKPPGILTTNPKSNGIAATGKGSKDKLPTFVTFRPKLKRHNSTGSTMMDRVMDVSNNTDATYLQDSFNSRSNTSNGDHLWQADDDMDSVASSVSSVSLRNSLEDKIFGGGSAIPKPTALVPSRSRDDFDLKLFTGRSTMMTSCRNDLREISLENSFRNRKAAPMDAKEIYFGKSKAVPFDEPKEIYFGRTVDKPRDVSSDNSKYEPEYIPMEAPFGRTKPAVQVPTKGSIRNKSKHDAENDAPSSREGARNKSPAAEISIDIGLDSKPAAVPSSRKPAVMREFDREKRLSQIKKVPSTKISSTEIPPLQSSRTVTSVAPEPVTSAAIEQGCAIRPTTSPSCIQQVESRRLLEATRPSTSSLQSSTEQCSRRHLVERVAATPSASIPGAFHENSSSLPQDAKQQLLSGLHQDWDTAAQKKRAAAMPQKPLAKAAVASQPGATKVTGTGTAAPAANASRSNNNNRRGDLIQVYPGIWEALRGSQETEAAIKRDFYTNLECLGCDMEVFCIRDARYVMCPSCKFIGYVQDEPEELNVNSRVFVQHGLGLGFTGKTLCEIKQKVRANVKDCLRNVS